MVFTQFEDKFGVFFFKFDSQGSKKKFRSDWGWSRPTTKFKSRATDAASCALDINVFSEKYSSCPDLQVQRPLATETTVGYEKPVPF